MEYTTYVDQMVSILQWLLVLVILGGLAFIVWTRTQYKIHIRLREVTKDRKLIFDDMARIYDLDGVTHWKLQKTKLIVPVAPEEAIEINRKGRKVVEAYLVDGEIEYIKDATTSVKPFQPMTTKQRHIFMHQLKKAHERRTKTWKDVVVPITAIVGLVTIVVSLMIFYGDIAKPVLDMGQQQAAMQKEMTHTVEILQEIIQNKEIIRQEEAPN